MATSLLIVESPTKQRTIARFLDKEWIVKSSMGHIRDLPANKLGINIKKDFDPTYVVSKGKSKIIKELKAAIKSVKNIYIATDEDREGEAIGWHIVMATKADSKRVKRIVFHEITKEAILEALKNPREIDMRLVSAQQARRILDRLVGYKISPLLGRKLYYGLSAGRVQSVALRLIVEREKEIGDFNPVEYWTVQAELNKDKLNQVFKANLIEKDGKKIEKLEIKSEEHAEQIKNDLTGARYIVSKVGKKQKKRNPSAPFSTSTLQQEASRKLYFSARKTMQIAQQLYEGIDIGQEGGVGLITYMRTDSLNIAKSAQEQALKYIEQEFGKNYLPSKPRIYKTKTKGAQEAHEAIRPTSVLRAPSQIQQHLSVDQHKLYCLIWQRFLASQMTSAVFNTISVDIKAKDYLFRVTGQSMEFDGYMKIYIEGADTKDEESSTREDMLPDFSVGEVLSLIRLISEQHFTEPPPRYNEATLIKTLEKYGIGRPSTYASIISIILMRKYVYIQDRKFFPEEIGKTVSDLLVQYFSDIIQVGFTAKMEDELDNIALGKSEWVKIIKRFWGKLSNALDVANTKMEHKSLSEPTDEICSLCSSPMVIRQGRYGKFMACSNFPKCRNTVSLDKEGNKAIPQESNEVCDKCSKPMVIRTGRRGRFLACSGYPECRNTKPLPVNDNSNQV